MEFNEYQAELLSNAVKAPVLLSMEESNSSDVFTLIANGLLLRYMAEGSKVGHKATAYGIMVVKTYEREQAEYQRGYKEGYEAGMYAGKHTGYSL